jgi:hypothetical membrane protein
MKYLLPAVCYFVVVIITAHFFAPPGYIWTRNTISDLASQGHTRKWIMQAGFIGFGILLAGGLALKSFAVGRINPADILILIYGLSVLVTGFFCEAPIDKSLAYSVREARLHSLFATVGGFSLSLGILWYLLAAASTPERIFHLVSLVLITGLSILFGVAEKGTFFFGQGVAQRALYLAAFVWLALV